MKRTVIAAIGAGLVLAWLALSWSPVHAGFIGGDGGGDGPPPKYISVPFILVSPTTTPDYSSVQAIDPNPGGGLISPGCPATLAPGYNTVVCTARNLSGMTSVTFPALVSGGKLDDLVKDVQAVNADLVAVKHNDACKDLSQFSKDLKHALAGKDKNLTVAQATMLQVATGAWSASLACR